MQSTAVKPRASPLLRLLLSFSWQELWHHPWRSAAAVLAVMLGVALAFSVHLINASALDEFSQAVRSVSAEPDLEVRAVQGGFAESLYPRLARDPAVALASPVLELSTYAWTAQGTRIPLRLLGVDALVLLQMAPALLPRPRTSDRFALFEPDAVFLNAAARNALGEGSVRLQSGLQVKQLRMAGDVGAGGNPLAVMDLGAAQDLFERSGQLTRIDLRLQPGTDRSAFIRTLQAGAEWPGNVTLVEPADSTQRIGNLSRAYRVNLTVLALVALFTGAFLVFSVLSLSVAKRSQQFALLAVLGLTGAQRLRLVLIESVALGLLGSLAGIALGGALAALALRLLGADLGGGYFSNATPVLHWDSTAAVAYTGLGVLAAAVGGWWPARQAQSLPPAQTLKGLGSSHGVQGSAWTSVGLLLLGVLLAAAPPLFDMPLAAYFAVGLLLLGGITALPWLTTRLLDRLAPHLARQVLPLLAVERARRVRESAVVAVSGVVAALSLAVALTVMVASFRGSVTRWLDVVLPADLYVRSAASASAAETVFFSAEFVRSVAALPGVQRLTAQRSSALLLDPAKPAVTLLSRALDDPERELPLVGELFAVPSGQIPIYVSEATRDLYGAQPGQRFEPLRRAFSAAGPQSPALNPAGTPAPAASFFVAGVWRDYSRQFGSIAIDRRDFERLSADTRANDLALWLRPGAAPAQVRAEILALAAAGAPGGPGAQPDFGSSSEIRAVSLKIFDRSFAVTYWLQAVAIGIGLFGVAASFSAQVLARRKEFGLLSHLGFTRAQILAVVAGEGAAWTAIGAVAGIALGLAVALVLVYVVNPQSFHWSMDLDVPWLRLGLLSCAVVLVGAATAWASGRAAAGRDAVLAVKEDW